MKAAAKVFAESGVDAPVREIAESAGVGLGTVYRHFPQRSDLIVAVFQSKVDACADAAVALAKEYPPVTALSLWLAGALCGFHPYKVEALQGLALG